MKKYLGLFLGLLLCFFVVTGCEKVENGNYKEGTYYGSYIDTYGGTSSVATAVVYVDESGMIKSVFLDTVYKKGDVLTTKKTLKAMAMYYSICNMRNGFTFGAKCKIERDEK